MKTQKTINIGIDVATKVKETGLNLSAFVDKQLRELFLEELKDGRKP